MDAETDSRVMTIDPRAISMFNAWKREKNNEVNNLEDTNRLEILSGIVGKMTEYTIRFCGMLHMADLAYEGRDFGWTEIIREETMSRALKAADYFYESAKNISERVNTKVIAPLEIITLAGYIKAGYSMQRIGDLIFPNMKNESSRRVKASRMVKKAIQDYPQVFGAQVK
jgi:hypothetical protein